MTVALAMLTATKLRHLLDNAASSKECFLVPCCWDGLSARMIDHAQFPCAFLSGKYWLLLPARAVVSTWCQQCLRPVNTGARFLHVHL